MLSLWRERLMKSRLKANLAWLCMENVSLQVKAVE